jgi:hypothetical protein
MVVQRLTQPAAAAAGATQAVKHGTLRKLYSASRSLQKQHQQQEQQHWQLICCVQGCV